MIRPSIFAALALTVGVAAHAQQGNTRAERKQAFKHAREAKAKNRVAVKTKTDWKAWLDKNFPDASSSWPAEASKSFSSIAGDAKWDYVGKGDIDRDGAPTALLLKFEEAPQGGYRIISHLVVAKWLDGKWNELLEADASMGLTVNGVQPGAMQSPDFHGYRLSLFAGDTDDADNPGMWIILDAVDQKGEVLTEPANFYYAPKSKRYGGSSY